ncbi:MAG: hypothetical protein SFU83_14820 [Meiothermus sp.]|nr:hypothetical protein [Meiothermus sp.]
MTSATVVIALLGLLSVVNPIMGFGIKPWGTWLLYSVASALGGFLLIAVVGISLYDALRPPGIQPVGPAGLGFMIVAFPYLLTNLVVLVLRWVAQR